jgi:cephalosporin hydroxylase
MPLNALDELAAKYGTDKSTIAPANLSAKSYTLAYSQYLEAVREEPIVLLEIGVWGGSSLLMWEDYLPNAKIIAIDIDPKCKRFETARSKIFTGDQTDIAFLKSVGEVAGPFDCIIDDGGHRMEHHQASLPALWPYLRERGWYAIEDLHTCYMSDFGGSYKNPRTTVERVLKPVLDSMNFSKAPETLVPDIESMHVYRSITFLFKGAKTENAAPTRRWRWFRR